MSREEEVLDKIKFVLLSNNEAQAIRLIEQYGFDKEERMSNILGLDHPYSLIHILNKLVEASDILMHEKNYDGHGWEIISETTKLAKEKIELLKE
jgi:hypothetical protein